MLTRRDLISAGMAGGLIPSTGAVGSASSETEQQADREGQREIAQQVLRVHGVLDRALLTSSLAHGLVAKLRQDMEHFLRANTKFPDFIEIGPAVFFDVYDWHVKHRQQIVVTRADGRYTIQFMFTTLILRSDQDRQYIGVPYDKA